MKFATWIFPVIVAAKPQKSRILLSSPILITPGYAVSQRLRKRVEEIFGWLKTVGNLRKTRHRGVERVSWVFTFTLTGYLLVRLRNLQAAIPG